VHVLETARWVDIFPSGAADWTLAPERPTVETTSAHPGAEVTRDGIPVEATDNLVSLRAFIAGLRSELKAAHADAEQDDSPDGPIFVVGPVNVEFTLTAKKDASAKGGVRFYVFELGASGSVGSETTQRVSLVLTPQTEDERDYKVSDDAMSEDPQ